MDNEELAYAALRGAAMCLYLTNDILLEEISVAIPISLIERIIMRYGAGLRERYGDEAVDAARNRLKAEQLSDAEL